MYGGIMLKKRKYKYIGALAALGVLAVVSVLKPEAAESVARAFVLLFGAW